MHMDGDAYEHSNLVLATVLLMKGHEGELTHKGAMAIWRYPNDEKSQKALEVEREFHAGEVRVEPVQFARTLRVVRGRMYDLLGLTSANRSPSS